MTPPKDRYRLEQVSNGCKAEFETFKNDKDQLYYFHFNDEDGQALLYSQGYKDARSRQRGIQALEKNIHRIESHQDGGEHYFVIRSGNRQELARSRNFDAPESMDRAIEQMQQMIYAGAAIGVTNVGNQLPKVPLAKKAPVQIAEKETHQPARYRFSLELQRRGEREALTGRIEYPVTGEEATFKGIDVAAIEEFITRFAKPAPARPVPPVVPKQAQELILTASQNGQALADNMLQPNAALELHMNVAAQSTNATTFLAKAYAKSLDSGSRTMIGERQGFVPESGDIALPVLLSSLAPGSYRLVTDVDLHAGSSIRRLEGSRLVHITQ